MISGSDSVFQLTKQALDAASLRQETITHNIANVKTKGYKAKVVDFESQLKEASQLSTIKLRGSVNRHYGTVSTNGIQDAKVVETKASTKMNLDGNNVDVDFEMMNMSANQIKYNALIRQTSEKINSFRYAIREGR